jgi:hypothetical protein
MHSSLYLISIMYLFIHLFIFKHCTNETLFDVGCRQSRRSQLRGCSRAFLGQFFEQQQLMLRVVEHYTWRRGNIFLTNEFVYMFTYIYISWVWCTRRRCSTWHGTRPCNGTILEPMGAPETTTRTMGLVGVVAWAPSPRAGWQPYVWCLRRLYYAMHTSL